MKRILVGIDGSEWSEIAARYALEFAAADGSDIQAVGVVPVDAVGGDRANAVALAYSSEVLDGEHMARRAVNEWFDKTERLCSETDVCFVRSLDVGDPAEQIPRAGITARLTVVGARGADEGRQRGNLGRVASAMLRSAIKPMMITRDQYRPIRHVLVGWDGRAEAAHALEMVYQAARFGDWQITMVAGAPPTSPIAETCLYVAQYLKQEGISVRTHLTAGDAPEVVLEAAKAFEPDLIAIGSRPKGAGGALFSGAAWREIVEAARVPVLLYR